MAGVTAISSDTLILPDVAIILTNRPTIPDRADRRADRAVGIAGDARTGGRCARCPLPLSSDRGRRRRCAELRALLDGVKRFGFAGVNVTFPYKEAVVPLLDELSPGARAIGAVNTVVVRDGRLIGYNTDTTGFERAIGNLVNASDRGPVALIGAGGVGKAIAYALASRSVSPNSAIFDTDRAKAAQLAAQLRGRQHSADRGKCRGRVAACRRRGQRNAGRHAAGSRHGRARRVVASAICGWPTRSIRRSGPRC